MGGLGGNEGHLNHLYEDNNLTFGELKKIFSDLIENKISLYEKVDGQNLSLSYNPKTHQPLAARNKSDIKSCGITLNNVADRYQSKPGVKFAFTSAMRAFNEVVRKLTYYQRFQIFDTAAGGIPFVNVEVMSTKNPNVIKYDGNYLVMHSLKRFPKSNRGYTCKETFDTIVSEFDYAEVQVDGEVWKIYGPKLIDLSSTMDRAGMSASIQQINELMNRWELDDQSTIRDFLLKSIFSKNSKLKLVSDDIRHALECRFLDEKGALPTPSIVKHLPDSQKLEISSLAKNRSVLLRDALIPLELIVNDFGLALLENSHSYFVSDGESQIENLRSKVGNAIKDLETSEDIAMKKKIDLNWGKLKKTPDSITSTVEGVVFNVGGKAYKITGAFAPMNQILGWVNPSFAQSRGKKVSPVLPIFLG